ncbi:MAG: reverse transcriptase/maturase family protein [bacterium]
MANIISLHEDLANKTYKHSLYEAFKISDPKPRDIHKAKVRDRLLHHAIYRVLQPFFDRTFISDSFSCRVNKGTHRAVNRLREFSYKVSKNHTRTAWVLKCDIRKFFASIDQKVLIETLDKYIPDQDILWLLSQIIGSFSTRSCLAEVGLPLGNLTSQLLVNIYMNEFDQFMKHKVKAKYYIRYADDFVILSEDKNGLVKILPEINSFLEDRLKLSLHPHKVYIKTIASGVDFLGWVLFPDHRVLRTSTKIRMMKNLRDNPKPNTAESYLGILSHGNGFKILKNIKSMLS